MKGWIHCLVAAGALFVGRAALGKPPMTVPCSGGEPGSAQEALKRYRGALQRGRSAAEQKQYGAARAAFLWEGAGT
jgi:hypothetical protein